MDERLQIIYKQFNGKLIGHSPLKFHVCSILSNMPEEIVAFITKTCWFMGSFEEAWAFTFTGNELKDQHLVFLSDELFTQDDSQIHWTIAHEIGHVYLGHRNSVLVKQTKNEIQKQEKEADDFARNYTS